MPRPFVHRPHPDRTVTGSVRTATVNLAESPLTWLHARHLLDDRQLMAGEQLRADFTRAGLEPSITMRWDAPPPDGSPRSVGGHDHASVARLEARRRFHAALDAVGSGLSDICWRVICAGDPMGQAERGLGWPARSGRLILAMALDRLADHYRLPA